jgi:hypothetical protein
MKGKNMEKHKFKVGDKFRAQGAEIEVVGTFLHEGQPAYEVRSPFTKGEPWLMLEHYLDVPWATRIRASKKKVKA